MKINRLLRKIAIPSLILFCALPVVAQTEPAKQNIQDQLTSRPIPERTIGLDPGKIQRWTEREAIMAALDKNVDIELEKENVRLIQYDIIALQGFYDPLTSSDVMYNRSIRATTFRASGLASGNTVTSDTLTYNFGLRKNIEKYGGGVQVDFNNSRSGSNTNTLSTLYSPSLSVSLSQPIFRNFRIDANRRAIKIAKKRLDLSDAQFRQRVIETISLVQQAYWNLALAIKNEGVARNSVTLSEKLLDNNKRQVDVGTLAQIDVISAATQVEQRRQGVFVAMDNVASAENTLKALTVGGTDDPLWNTKIEPIERFDVKPFSIPLADAIRLAQENRPEVKQFGLQKEMNKIDTDFYRDQSKPQIDFIASYNTSGLGGTPSIQTFNQANCSNPLPDISDPNKLTCVPFAVTRDAAGNVIPVVVQNQVVPFTLTSVSTPSPIDSRFVGGYGTSLKNLFKNDFRTWNVGLQFNFPLRNRTAKANLAKSQETGRQLDLQTRRLLQNIEVEVRNAVQAIETAKLRIEAATAQREYAARQLDGEQKKFAAGMQTTFFVLQRQNELVQAQVSELQAQADYNIAVTHLQKVISTTLSSNSIEIKTDPPVTIK